MWVVSIPDPTDFPVRRAVIRPPQLTEEVVQELLGCTQAKHALVQIGRVPTSANWPWETIRVAEWNDGNNLPPRYVVTGTVEVNGSVSQWSALVMFESGNVKGCMVDFVGEVVWTLPTYAQQLSNARQITSAP